MQSRLAFAAPTFIESDVAGPALHAHAIPLREERLLAVDQERRPSNSEWPSWSAFQTASSELEWQVIAAMQTAFVLLAIALLTSQAAAQTPRSRQTPTASTQTYESVDVDGNLRILTSEQRTIIVLKNGCPQAGESFARQTAFDNPVLSGDRHAVGAQAMFENCCTSYDIPLQLVIYSKD